ncbi:hypothetical protein ACQP2E_30430 [Actinoplanes sp. CA-015351]|uniref:hypothetical protein n=1 Tax=Actinoplanes sp. CA-015351 TaxID=3239897 RepID=UPI003D982524
MNLKVEIGKESEMTDMTKNGKRRTATAAAPASRQRLQAATGLVGIALLGTGLIGACGTGDDRDALSSSTPAAAQRDQSEPAVPPGSPSPTPGDSVSKPAATDLSSTEAKPSTTVSLSAADQERVEAARENGKKNSTKITRPYTVSRQGGASPGYYPQAVDQDVIGDLKKDGETMRVYTSRQDLTGYQELAWVVNGERIGEAFCTQTIKLSSDKKTRTRPTLLICWRTSAEKSVYTVLVDVDKKPSKNKSLSVIKKEWARLG